MNIETIIEIERKASVVTTINGRDVTRGELSIAFDAVANKDNWKMPIDATVNLDPYTMGLVKEAVIFFAGCVPTFERIGGTTTSNVGQYRVRAAGYYASVGA